MEAEGTPPWKIPWDFFNPPLGKCINILYESLLVYSNILVQNSTLRFYSATFLRVGGPKLAEF